MTSTDDLAAHSEHNRQQRERRTALTVAFSELARNGGSPSVAAIARLLSQRIDGTTATLRDPGEAVKTGPTNQNDHITQAVTPLETDRQDY